jgi:hypothetical protein
MLPSASIFLSSLSILELPKKMSNASKTVDFPASFFPVIPVKELSTNNVAGSL